MAQTVKLPDDIMSDIREEAALQSRSLASQVVHWIKLGRQLESRPGMDMAKIRAALKGELNPDLLTGEEQVEFFDQFNEKMSDIGSLPGVNEAYAALGED
ncbi:TA system antitoxin ParD family protein [Litorimonas sp. WD9-15]|uniref:TA system antitoxin ParD family protein n=1 Tax=Litorimonas sp. WD9-15 TaxID=3418716 RepID=UPI003D069AA3